MRQPDPSRQPDRPVDPDQPYRTPASGIEGWSRGRGLPDAPAGASEWWLPADRLLSVGELWQICLRLMAACIGPIALVVLLVRLPISLSSAWIEQQAASGVGDDAAVSLEDLLPTIVFWLLGVGTSLTILFAAREMLESGKVASMESLTRRVGHSFWPAITTEAMALFLILVGLVLCLVPGAVALSYLAFTLPAVALRGVRNRAALSYSLGLVRNNWSAVFTRLFAMLLPMLALILIYAVLLSLKEEDLLPDAFHAEPIFEFAGIALGSFLIDLAFIPWILATLVLLLNLEAYKQSRPPQ